ncbi:esterase D [Parvularcula bermudensis HTCC2503]|uniref:S-formylglutathione hydrolase n=1 Tax=Parvularcula bermudensis (strain ATCC BAA-594 / HTCC2503 / KCTC 12087) TaxID=314260 RepID=E0TE23_PARBH|nr:S-formylglutathione hydrolase [Parvularcula bermudensis]ADM08844.1 esterase D [Parvularcula bermudensis HTCC2503]
METVSEVRSHGGLQGVYRHASTATATEMTFSVFVPDHPKGASLPVVWYLSGLTCTHANVTEKGEFRRACKERGLVFVAPDTSPRGPGVADDDSYDLGQGAGFYLNATEAPWAPHFHMRRYIEEELPSLIAASFPVDLSRQSLMGHSMGGHGALTIGLRNEDRFKSVSAFAPIVASSKVPWGERAFTAYLGPDRTAWAPYDACALIAAGRRLPALLVDQGTADTFLERELQPQRLEAACAAAGQPLTLRRQDGYDHSYYFISTFMADHLHWHADHLG